MPRTLDDLKFTAIYFDAVPGAKFSLNTQGTALRAYHKMVFIAKPHSESTCHGCTAFHLAPDDVRSGCCVALPDCSGKVFVEDRPEAIAYYIAAQLANDRETTP